MVESRKRARLVLIASDGEWAGRSLESVLELNGYSVVRVERGRRALELARRTPLDAIFLDAATADMGGIEVCRALRDDPLFDHSTPIIITSAVAGAHRAGAAAFAAGAWEYCSQPFDVETLMLKLGTFVRAADTVREVFDIPAGGIRLEGRVGDVRIPLGQIAFEIFTGSQFDSNERRPIAQNVQTGDVVLLPEGTYYIVSNYGDGNSVVRSDIHIDAGKLTDIVVTHRAAIKTLKLVNNPGGEALANTQWTVLTPGGDVIKESIGAFPRLVLAEGDYHVVARNEGRTYQRDFKVITGVDGEVEVLAR